MDDKSQKVLDNLLCRCGARFKGQDVLLFGADEIKQVMYLIESQQARITMLSEDLETHEKVFREQQAEIERLKPLAELGILACNIFDETQHKTCREVGYDENCNKNCAWLDFCRKRAELRGG